ncbi:MAG: amidohydrolase family protein [Acidobacteriaceae bacterium]|nr:amidohydrolase family protein [Acidobacteriaceae bacterium]MBV9779065.1 amidohydrolase family protein [Acidobacteriaceae bacterium]
MKPYIAQIRSNLRLMGRDRSVLFFSYLFPLVFFFPFAQLFGGKQSPAAMAQVISMVLIIGVLGSGFFGAGMRAVQDRETNVLRRFKVAPINAGPIIIASLVSGLVAFLPTVFLFIFFARVIYHMPVPHNLLSLVLFVCLGVVSFRAMGMIIAATVNSAQEAGILTQILYLPMLFMSGATFPMSFMPLWIQKIAQFLPATYLFQGMQSIMIQGESLAQNMASVVALMITLCVAVFVGIKLFRWEKEDRIKNSAKLWILAVLAPFLFMGVYQARTQQNIEKARILAHKAERNRSLLFQNARIFVGTGKVIPNGAVLIRRGKITNVFETPPQDTKSLDAEVIDVSGKTLIPGLIDMHVHLGAPGGVYQDAKAYMDPNAPKRRLAAYLYSGITAVRSTGDWLDNSVQLRATINSGEYLGAELFACGPLFTAPGGHPTELIKYFPENIRKDAERQFVRLPKSGDEARKQVDDLKNAGVDCIKAVLESGNSEWGVFNRLDTGIYHAVIAEAIKDNLPSATHTGSASDVKDAVDAGTNSIEHGSMVDTIPVATLEEMKQKGIAYDPTLSVFEGLADLRTGNFELLNRSLLQQVGPADLLTSTRAVLGKEKPSKKPEDYKPMLDRDNQNLLAAYKAGVLLITGSDAGNMLVIHGPTVQHEMELWVKAGIPAAETLQAATYNAARVLRADDRIGSIQAGRDASFVLLDGDPAQDISNSERISMVIFRGQRVDRSELFDQEK